MRPPSARLLPVFCRFPCTYYTTEWALCLDITGFFNCSGDINYWQDEEKLVNYQWGNVDVVEFYVIPEQVQQLVGLDTNKIDIVTGLTYEGAKAYMGGGEKSEGYVVFEYLDQNTRNINFNCNEASPCSDVNLRKAIAYAIDAQGLLDGVLDGHGEVTVGCNSRFGDYVESWNDLDYFFYNEATAKDYLSKSNYNGETLVLLTDTDEIDANCALMVQLYLESIGIKTELLTVDTSILKTTRLDYTAWDMLLTYGGSADYETVAWRTSWDHNVTADGLLPTGTLDEKLDELLSVVRNVNTFNDESVDAFMQISLLHIPPSTNCGQKRTLFSAELTGWKNRSLVRKARRPLLSWILTVSNWACSNEAEVECTMPVASVNVPAHTRKAKRIRKETYENLPVEEVVHHAEDSSCNTCGAEMTVIGKEFVRDEIIFVKARLFVRKHYVETLKCPQCGTDENQDAALPEVAPCVFKKAVAPKPLMPYSPVSPELLAHVIYEKYKKAVPLYRLESDFKAMGYPLSRATMANWINWAATEKFSAVYELMKQDLLSGTVVHADETPVQVLKEPGRKAANTSRMWVYCAGKASGKHNVVFEYQPTRGGYHAAQFLDGYHGYLMTDDFGGYNKAKEVRRCLCWAHTRRYFVKALPKDTELLQSSQAAVAVQWCNKIYELDQKYADHPAEDRLKNRQENIKPVLDEFFAWAKSLVVAALVTHIP